ncbi:hypothetical protein [Prolixibacter bellariivorans]|uniref:hypothetical protein n=1 Tax=Prolixibacter bellariivorans TaxID=314319 RepID=UPI001F216170|nr:hypothetical protein [Prolixibacter bellariivorans]
MRTWKVWEQRLVKGISFLAAYSVIFILLFLLFVVFSKGLKALSWGTVFSLPKEDTISVAKEGF